MNRSIFRTISSLSLGLALAGIALAQTPVPPATKAAALPSPATPAKPAAAPADDPNAIRVLLSPELETTLVSQMAGRIVSLHAQLGARVQKGQVVVRFECDEATARQDMARAELAAAQETLRAKQDMRKLDAVGDMEVALAAASADKAKAAVALAKAQVAQCTVVAPFSGRVVKAHVKPHQGVSAGTQLLDLVSDGPLKIRLNAPSRWLAQLREGTPFEVAINETGRSYPAKVTAINARVDAVAQSIELEARLDGMPRELRAGMSGTARFRIAP